jgi:hypothetical protein
VNHEPDLESDFKLDPNIDMYDPHIQGQGDSMAKSRKHHLH